MHYVKQILFPGEKVLYDGHVHPRVLFRGVALLGLTAFTVQFTQHTGNNYPYILSWLQSWSASSGFIRWIYQFCYGWQAAAPDTAFEFKVLELIELCWGLKHLIGGLLLMRSTELVVTDIRIIAKTGIFNIMTLEMDRRRVAEVLIDQTMWGRIMNYGHIYIRGFTGVIGGMPVMVNPHLIDRYVNMRY